MARAAERVCAHMRARGRVCEARGRNEGMAVSEKGEKRGRRKTFSADKKSKQKKPPAFTAMRRGEKRGEEQKTKRKKSVQRKRT